jgi:septum formation initiator
MARKRKKAIGILENKFAIIFVTGVVISMAIIIGLKARSIKQELAKREAYNQKVIEELESEGERAKKLEEQRKYVQTDSYIIEMAREKLGLVFPDEIAIKAEK